MKSLRYLTNCWTFDSNKNVHQNEIHFPRHPWVTKRYSGILDLLNLTLTSNNLTLTVKLLQYSTLSLMKKKQIYQTDPDSSVG